MNKERIEPCWFIGGFGAMNDFFATRREKKHNILLPILLQFLYLLALCFLQRRQVLLRRR